MTWAAIAGEIAALVSTFVGVVAFVLSVRRAARKQRDDETARIQAKFDEGAAAGRAARDDEVNLLRSQRDDAREERDRALRRADDLERELWRRTGNGGAK